MTHTASKELSQELYKLSGWADTGLFWYEEHDYDDDPDGRGDFYHEPRIYTQMEIEETGSGGGGKRTQAYDLGYLMRNLPKSDDDIGDLTITFREGSSWFCGYFVVGDPFPNSGAWASTPEDAACKLAIELFKNGILTRSEN